MTVVVVESLKGEDTVELEFSSQVLFSESSKRGFNKTGITALTEKSDWRSSSLKKIINKERLN